MAGDVRTTLNPVHPNAIQAAESAHKAVAQVPKTGPITGERVRDMIVDGTRDLDGGAATAEHRVLDRAFKQFDADGRVDERGRRVFGIYDGYAARSRQAGKTGIPVAEYKRMQREMNDYLAGSKPFTVEGGKLNINGTEGHDTGQLDRAGDNFTLRFNGNHHEIPAAGIKEINADLRGGDDKFVIGRQPTAREMIERGAAGRPAVPAGNFPRVTVNGGAGNDEIRNNAAEGAVIDAGSGRNNVVNYGDRARIVGGTDALDTVANAGANVTIDHSRAAGLTVDQIADGGNITGTRNVDVMRIRGDNNRIDLGDPRPPRNDGNGLLDDVRFLNDVDGAPTSFNRVTERGQFTPRADVATIKANYSAALLDDGNMRPGAEVVPMETALRGLLNPQHREQMHQIMGDLGDYWRSQGRGDYASHAVRSQEVFQQAMMTALANGLMPWMWGN